MLVAAAERLHRNQHTFQLVHQHVLRTQDLALCSTAQSLSSLFEPFEPAGCRGFAQLDASTSAERWPATTDIVCAGTLTSVQNRHELCPLVRGTLCVVRRCALEVYEHGLLPASSLMSLSTEIVPSRPALASSLTFCRHSTTQIPLVCIYAEFKYGLICHAVRNTAKDIIRDAVCWVPEVSQLFPLCLGLGTTRGTSTTASLATLCHSGPFPSL